MNAIDSSGKSICLLGRINPEQGLLLSWGEQFPRLLSAVWDEAAGDGNVRTAKFGHCELQITRAVIGDGVQDSFTVRVLNGRGIGVRKADAPATLLIGAQPDHNEVIHTDDLCVVKHTGHGGDWCWPDDLIERIKGPPQPVAVVGASA